jgi:hypothetical protein
VTVYLLVDTFGRDEGRDSSDVSGRAEKEAVSDRRGRAEEDFGADSISERIGGMKDVSGTEGGDSSDRSG